MPAKIQRVFVFSIAACAIAVAGCSSETQQQKFVDALNHGNSAQASQIWLHMDAQSREDFSHSQGIQPESSPAEVKKQITQHYQDEAGNGTGDNEGTVDQPPMVHLGGLQSLPEWVGPSGAPPQTVTVPDVNTPSN